MREHIHRQTDTLHHPPGRRRRTAAKSRDLSAAAGDYAAAADYMVMTSTSRLDRSSPPPGSLRSEPRFMALMKRLNFVK